MSGSRGWCPTAWRPMAAGDGLILRIRPRLARLSPGQARTIAEVARTQGNGLIDLTNRAALQVRGLTEAGWPRALDTLVAAGLVDPDPVREARAMLVAPDWRAGDDTHRLAGELIDRLDALPPLSGKIGLAIDAGEAAVLTDSPADFRIERGTTGALILRADGHATGCAVRAEDAVAALVALAQWFVASGGEAAGRMARHDAALPDWARGDIRPMIAPAPPMQGAHPLGTAIGLTFGRIGADRLEAIAALPGVTGIRLTPWRMIVVEGVGPDAAGLADAGPVDLSVDACVGAPACPQATVETRALALRLSARVTGRLHVSGCAKGCARHAPAAVVATGREGKFDLSHNARAGDPPVATGLTPDALLALFESDCRAP